MSKKVLTLVLAVMMLVGMCAIPASASGEKVQIALWHMYGESAGLNDVVDQFNASQDEVEVIPSYYATHDDLLTKLQVTASTGSSERPNVILIDCVKASAVDQIFPLVDLTAYLDQSENLEFDDFYPVFQKFSKNTDGEIVSLHGWSNCLILYYNKALFREAGLDPEVAPKSWEEIIEYGKKLTNADKGIWGYEPGIVRDNSNEGYSWEWQALTMTAGGKIWNEDQTQILFNDKPAVEALQFWHDCIYEHKITTMSPPENGFENGYVAMQVGGTWMGGQYTAALGDDLGCSVLYGKDGNAATCAGGEHLMIVQSDKEHEDASWKFLSYIFSEEPNAAIARNNGMIPTRVSIAQSDSYADVLEIPYIKTTVEMVENYGITRCTRPDYPTFSSIAYNYIQAVLYDTMTPEDAIAQFAAEVTATLGL